MKILNALITYALEHGLLSPRDTTYAQNALLSLLQVTDPKQLDSIVVSKEDDINTLLGTCLEWALEKKIILPHEVDLFDTKIMGILCPMPSVVQQRFDSFSSPQEATQYFYKLSIASNYIRMNRVAKNVHWKSILPKGELEVTINLSKPEIVRPPNLPPPVSSGYPLCLLCKENEGCSGNDARPARENLRIVEMSLGGEPWFMQYSPYIYYPEHCIVFTAEHRPMKVNAKTLANLFEFLERFPHYFIGSNAGLPIVGGSILEHEHYQGGCYSFPLHRARTFWNQNIGEVQLSLVQWPMDVLRLRSSNKESLLNLAERILAYWISYENLSLGIHKETGGRGHNAITPIVKKDHEVYVLDIILRNNRTTEELPLGVFHPHPDKHHIKKENIGLIEVMGLAILPGRLVEELKLIKPRLLTGNLVDIEENCLKHLPWMEELLKNHALNSENIDDILREDISRIFFAALQDCSLFKTQENLQAFTEEMIQKFV